MVAAFTDPLMVPALGVGLLVGFLASYYGVFLVQRRQAFLGSGLAHAAYGGVGLGIFLGFQPEWTTLPYTVLIAVAIVWIGNRTTLASDTIIGIFFSVSMALGAIFLSLSDNFTGDANTYLFGNVIYTTKHDLITAGLAVLATLMTFPLWRRWAYATFDPMLARSDGHSVERDDMILAVAIAIVIAISIKLVGILLIAAFLVLPPASARLLCNTFAGMTKFAVIIGMLTSTVGLCVANQLDLYPGATIILVQAAVFFTILAARGVAKSD